MKRCHQNIADAKCITYNTGTFAGSQTWLEVHQDVEGVNTLSRALELLQDCKHEVNLEMLEV